MKICHPPIKILGRQYNSHIQYLSGTCKLDIALPNQPQKNIFHFSLTILEDNASMMMMRKI